ncbi:MAG: hypothetical protein UV67_C0023G0020 [Parcubacteria group bacterium GW2011_GWC1_43_12]|nr:MAG: hypothetical protein UV67_C0023G0020 [Parcubacteria group bacterium GW2011_GWC1_43_12]
MSKNHEQQGGFFESPWQTDTFYVILLATIITNKDNNAKHYYHSSSILIKNPPSEISIWAIRPDLEFKAVSEPEKLTGINLRQVIIQHDNDDPFVALVVPRSNNKWPAKEIKKGDRLKIFIFGPKTISVHKPTGGYIAISEEEANFFMKGAKKKEF